MSTFEGSGRFINDELAFYVDFTNKKSFSPNMINYSTWTTGLGGISQNSTIYGSNGFSLNGSGDENIRVIDTDPFGNNSIIWKSSSMDDISGRLIVGSTSLTSSGDGGWNGSRFTIDPNKMYRFSVWTKRTGMTIGSQSGAFYLGFYSYGQDSLFQEIKLKSNGATASNAYFHYTSVAGALSSVNPPNLGGMDVWTLVVGHVWPASTPTASLVIGSDVNGLPLNYNHQDSGIWTQSGHKVGNLYIGDWIWNATSSQTLLRTYLFYSEDIVATQSFVYPRVDLVDGTEPTIQQLLSMPEPVKNLMTNGYNGHNTSLNDIIYTKSANFSPENNGCIIFNSSKEDYIQGTISTTFSMNSASIWFKPSSNINASSTGGTLFQVRNGSSYAMELYLGNVTGLVTNEVITLSTSSPISRTAVTDITITGDTWNNIIINWESTSYAIYLNGEKKLTTPGTSVNVEKNSFVDYLVLGARLQTGVFGSFFNGRMSSVAMWNKTLSNEEILNIYKKGKSKLEI